MGPTTWRCVGAILVLAIGAPFALARPAHRQALGDYLGPFQVRKLNDCRVCHVGEAPTEKDNAHNAFGTRLKAVKDELRQAGKKTDIAHRLDAAAEDDSDGDGVTNLLELLSGHFPGDAKDKPSDAELTEARKTLVAFTKFRSAYPWRPFETVHRPAVPAVKDAGWVRNPIDAFIRAEHEEHGLTPRPEAARHVLLRRIYLDLIGLPPTRQELQAFLNDSSPDAYEKVVDRLLSSPQYGERWGRHWMDVWRYSDWAGWTGGNQIRDSQPHIWRWRDWIVESLNKDKGYDRMVLEMLAADELTPEDPDALRATGYLVRNYKMLSREKWLQDTVDHTAMAFLGVTLGCARCHDHMYDPIQQREYYQVRAIFEPHQVRIDRIPGQADTKKDGLVRAYDAQATAPTYLFIRGDDRTPDKSAIIPPGVPEALGGEFPTIEEVKLTKFAFSPDKRPYVIEETIQASKAALTQAEAALAGARKTAVLANVSLLSGTLPEELTLLPEVLRAGEALTLADLAWQAAEARHRALLAVLQAEDLEDNGKKDSAEWKIVAETATGAQRQAGVFEGRRNLLVAQHAQRVAPEPKKAEAAKNVAAAEKALSTAETAIKAPVTTAYTKRPTKDYPPISTGRRLAFARWIADRANPLTARVAMNHVWLRHFGQAIVPSVFDFGRNGRPATHPALLDWLAAEFQDSGWSMKAMHRLMVTSNTYRMASTGDARSVELDRDNKYYWRMPSRRMEAEVVRDCLYHVTGKLDVIMGGPDIDQNLGLSLPRRSIYFRHAQEKQMEFLKIFDTAAVTECYQRKESVLPQQALALANNPTTRPFARQLARALAVETGDARAFVAAAFEQLLSRPATDEETQVCLDYLSQQTAHYVGLGLKPGGASTDANQASSDPAIRAREELVHVLLNHNDFVTIR